MLSISSVIEVLTFFSLCFALMKIVGFFQQSVDQISFTHILNSHIDSP